MESHRLHRGSGAGHVRRIQDAKRPGCIPTQSCPEFAEGAHKSQSALIAQRMDCESEKKIAAPHFSIYI